MKKFLILIIICLFLCSCAMSEQVSKNVTTDSKFGQSTKLTLSMVGDAIIYSSIYKDALDEGKYDFGKMIESIKPIAESSDLLYYNQESIIGGDNLGFYGFPKFNTPANFAKTMISYGFNLVSRANEHALDQGEKGLLNSCNFWNKYSEVTTGGSFCTSDEQESLKIFTKNGFKIAFLNYTDVPWEETLPKEYYLNVYSEDRAKEDLDKIADETDLKIVAIHWGEEGSNEPTERQKGIAKFLAEVGVDVIIGTHPSVIQPVEMIGNTIVFYSLGNFLSGQDKGDDYNKRIGLLGQIDFIKVEYGSEKKVVLDKLYGELLFIDSKDGRDYRVIPFSDMDDSILKGFKDKKIKYESVVKKYISNIEMR